MKKRMFVAIIAAVMTIGAAAAQPRQQNDGQKREKPTAEQMAKFRTERMAKALDLNDEQQKQLYDLTLTRINDAQKKAEAARSDIEAARKSNAEQMKKILTPEQYEKWGEMQKRQAQMGRAQGQQGGWQGHGPQMGQGPRGGQHVQPGHHGQQGPAHKHGCKGKKHCGKCDCQCHKHHKGHKHHHKGHKPAHKPADKPAGAK